MVREDRSSGENLTTRILRHADVQRGLAKAEENPRAWAEDLRSKRASHPALAAFLG
jgi:hypothetical protein